MLALSVVGPQQLAGVCTLRCFLTRSGYSFDGAVRVADFRRSVWACSFQDRDFTNVPRYGVRCGKHTGANWLMFVWDAGFLFLFSRPLYATLLLFLLVQPGRIHCPTHVCRCYVGLHGACGKNFLGPCQ